MEINKFISKVLDELQDLKTNDNKKRYIVQDLEFELSVAISKDGKGKLEVSNSFLGFDNRYRNIQETHNRYAFSLHNP